MGVPSAEAAARVGSHPVGSHPVGGHRVGVHDGGRAKAIVAALAITQTVGYGTLYYAFAVFLVPVAADLHTSTTAVTGTFTASVLASAALAVPVGRWLDRHGGRVLMTAGSATGALLLVTWSQVHSLWQLYAVQIGIGFASAACLYEAAFAVIIAWHSPARRSAALLALTVVAGFASTIFLPLTSRLIELHGWRTALLLLAAIQALLTVPLHVAVVRAAPPSPDSELDGHHSRSVVRAAPPPPEPDSHHPRPVVRAAPPSPEPEPGRHHSRPVVRAAPPSPDPELDRRHPRPVIGLRVVFADRGFWLLVVSFTAHSAAVAVVTVHLIAALIAWGHRPVFAAAVAGLFGVLSVAGRLATTGLQRRHSTAVVVSVIFAVQGLAAAALPVVGRHAIPVVVAVVGFGIGFGVGAIAKPVLLADRYGTGRYATIAGLLVMPMTAARAAAPLAAAGLHTATGDYGGVFLVTAGLCLIAAGALAAASRDDGRRAGVIARVT